jgi:molybdate transport system regulatory protein
MKTSARNQLSGTVSAVRKGAVNAEVDVTLKGGAVLTAQITLPSVGNLGLATGTPVVALLKASWVVLGIGEEAPKVSSRNRLKGVVASVTRGAVNAEVILTISGGETVVAGITNESVDTLGLAMGTPVWALFKASAIILGV